MQIVSVAATRFRLPFGLPVALSTGVRKHAEHVLVSVITDDGVTGHAECIPRPAIYGETPETAALMIEHVLGPAVVGIDISDTQLAHARLAGLVGNPSARSSVELAAFDALGKTLALPAHRLLGGFTRQVRCCPVLGYGTPERVVAEAVEFHERYGSDTVKFKIGADLSQDIAVTKALRTELGEQVTLYADANGRYSVAEAAAFVDATSDCRLRWLEEPLPATDLTGRRRIAERSAVPILGDESCADPHAVAVEVLAGRSSAISIKPARTGIVASGAIRDFCGSLGIPVLIGTQGDSAIGAMTAAALAAAHPALAAEAAEIMFFLDFADSLLSELPSIVQGQFTLPDAPGFGFAIDPDKVARYRVAD